MCTFGVWSEQGRQSRRSRSSSGRRPAFSEQNFGSPIQTPQTHSHARIYTITGLIACSVFPGIAAAVSRCVRLHFSNPQPASSRHSHDSAAFQHHGLAFHSQGTRWVGARMYEDLRMLLNSFYFCRWLLLPPSSASHASPSLSQAFSLLPFSPFLPTHPRRR